MDLCQKCKWYDKQFDDFRMNFDDIEDADNRENHACIMYDDYIPQEIWYDGANCPYYQGSDAYGH